MSSVVVSTFVPCNFWRLLIPQNKPHMNIEPLVTDYIIQFIGLLLMSLITYRNNRNVCQMAENTYEKNTIEV